MKEHPEWFHHRPDGSIAYAENPPKKYQDIYPLNFWPEKERDREALWEACFEIFDYWIAHGVTAFRVDNPHTKPFAFWEWVINAVRVDHPETIFLAEAFTRPPVMAKLAEVGFTQSYTYFTWRTALGARGVPHRAGPRPEGRLHAAELLAQHARHPRRPPARWPAGVPVAVATRGNAQPELRHLLRLRAVRERARVRCERGVLAFGEVPTPAARLGSTRFAGAVHHHGQRHPPATSRVRGAAHDHVPRRRQREHHRVLQAAPPTTDGTRPMSCCAW